MKKLYAVVAILVLAAMLIPACTPTAPDCTLPEVFCVGMVTDVGKIDDKSFNQSAWEGLQAAREAGVADWVQYIETTDAKDYDKNIQTFADAGYDVIVTVGFALGEATYAAAAAYPEIYFIGIDQFQEWPYDDDPSNDLANFTSLNFPEDQAGFLVGALAAMMSDTGTIGAVCGTDAVPPVWRFGEGYRAGATYINPDINVLVVYHSDVGFDKTFTDPEWGAATAGSMIDQGADVIFGAGGKTGNGAVIEAAARGVYAIGVDTDQYYTLPEAASMMLSSAMKLITPGVAELISLARDAQNGGAAFPAGNYNGQAGYAPYHDLEDMVPQDVKDRMEEINAMLLSGELQTGVPPVKP
ncbi:MAG: BMP family ABC transporter substrate-binding protein [Anaerolineales bacterium]|nr:BMP family ABC transporter substrate-binding protein [Anaerolineales bacterium]